MGATTENALSEAPVQKPKLRRRDSLAHWGMAVSLVFALVVGGWFAWSLGSGWLARSRAYDRGAVAMDAGEFAVAANAFAEAGSYDDAPARRQEALLALAPYRAKYLDGLTAMDSGDFRTALTLFASIQTDLPEFEDVDQQLLTAKAGLQLDLQSQLDIATVQHEWLQADQLLNQLIALEPDDQELHSRLIELRAEHAPLLYAQDGDLYLIGPDESDQRMLIDDLPVSAASWSPDRSRIAFLSVDKSQSGSVSLYIVDSDGSNRQRLSESASLDPYFSWSPDGANIAYVRTGGMVASSRDFRSTIVIHDIDTGAEAVVEPLSLVDQDADLSIDTISPTWSPDSSQLAYIAVRRPTGPRGSSSYRFGDIQVMNLRSGEVRSLTGKSIPYAASVSWSPAGNYLLAWESRTGTAWFESSETAIYLIDPASAEIAPLTSRTESSGRPVWSPDGQRFAVIMNNGALKIRWVPGKRERTIAIDHIEGAFISWSPNGDALLISTINDVLPSLRVNIDVESAPETELSVKFDSDWPNLGLVWGSGYASMPDSDNTASTLEAQ